MEDTKKFALGPTMAIIVIIAVTAIGGIYFYKNMIQDYTYNVEPTAIVVVPDIVVPDTIEVSLSKSSDLDAIEADLSQDLVEEVDLSFVDTLDQELLNFDDLDSIDLNF